MLRLSARIFGTVLIVAGILALAWVLVVWQWGDPVTALYARYEQRGLRNAYAEQTKAFVASDTPPVVSPAPEVVKPPIGQVLRRIDRDAVAYRKQLQIGDPVGVLDVPKMALHAVVVNGTDHDSLRRGPGRDPRTAVPGEHELVYVAGHRTTYGAPFADIDQLKAGDRISFDVPYARFVYAVTGHRIVAATELSVLRSRGIEQLALQACHPRFFATQRYIADAKLVSVAVPNGHGGWTAYRLPRA